MPHATTLLQLEFSEDVEMNPLIDRACTISSLVDLSQIEGLEIMKVIPVKHSLDQVQLLISLELQQISNPKVTKQPWDESSLKKLDLVTTKSDN